jgi:hypothetical protein
MAELFVVNPGGRRGSRKRSRGGQFKKGHKRARARARAHNPSRKRRRRSSSYMHNPFKLPGLGGIDLKSIGWGVVGAIGAELGTAQAVKFLPANISTNTAAKLGVKAGVIFLATMLAKHTVGGSAARAIAVGGGIALGVEIVRDYVLPIVPGASALMSDYVFGSGVSDYQLAGPGASSEVPRRWGSNWSSD